MVTGAVGVFDQTRLPLRTRLLLLAIVLFAGSAAGCSTIEDLIDAVNDREPVVAPVPLEPEDAERLDEMVEQVRDEAADEAAAAVADDAQHDALTEADSAFGGPPPPPGAYRAEARWILDGDSLDIIRSEPAEGERERAEVRLLGVNANEGVECFGNAARDALIERIGRQEVLVVEDGFDQYGRVLAFVWHNDELVNLWLVDNGFAVARSSFDHDYEELFDAAEELARVSEVGLWSPSACGAPSDAAVVISMLNFDAEGRDNENPNGEWIELTNQGSVAVDLSEWVIRDESTRHRFVFESFILAPTATVTVRSGCGTDGPAELFWCAETTIWSNSGDTAFVRDGSGALVDSYSYASIYDD